MQEGEPWTVPAGLTGLLSRAQKQNGFRRSELARGPETASQLLPGAAQERLLRRCALAEPDGDDEKRPRRPSSADERTVR
eukprot:4190962-Alexandrium_andersonii.AAC.1